MLLENQFLNMQDSLLELELQYMRSFVIHAAKSGDEL
jgi:hypothetical protein